MKEDFMERIEKTIKNRIKDVLEIAVVVAIGCTVGRVLIFRNLIDGVLYGFAAFCITCIVATVIYTVTKADDE